MVIELPESGGSLPSATSFRVKMKCNWEIASQDHARSSFGKKNEACKEIRAAAKG